MVNGAGAVMRERLRIVLPVLVCAAGIGTAAAHDGSAPPSATALRIDQLRLLGTHNSYHLAPDRFTAGLVAAAVPEEARAIDCSQRPLAEQLERLGVRHLELDCYRDPEGGRFAGPLALALAGTVGRGAAVEWREDLERPGVKVLHSPGFDFRTTVPSLEVALCEVKRWSDSHRGHVPLFLLLELKSDAFVPPQPLPWTEDGFGELEATILGVFPRERILAPDDVRAGAATLRDAVAGKGWPSVEDHRGKVVFLLDNEGEVRDAYLAASPVLEGRLLFASVPRDHPAAAFMKRNDPVAEAEAIRSLVAEGFLVRTRVDAGLDEPRRGDLNRFRRAVEVGAQLLSTDVPEPSARYPGYVLDLPAPPEEPEAEADRGR